MVSGKKNGPKCERIQVENKNMCVNALFWRGFLKIGLSSLFYGMKGETAVVDCRSVRTERDTSGGGGGIRGGRTLLSLSCCCAKCQPKVEVCL